MATLHPALFAMVMATGIVSIACRVTGLGWLGDALLWINVIAFLTLVVLTGARCCLYPGRILQDLTDHQRGVGFFTLPAAICVLGTQLVIFHQAWILARGLLVAGLATWMILLYTVFTAYTVRRDKPGLSEGIHGGWLVAVVATQALSILVVRVVPGFLSPPPQMLFLALSLWLCGAMLYIWIISLIFYRYFFFELAPSDLTPPYWINMGAMAISTLAGTMLIESADHLELLAELLPFLKGFTLLFWATATWWIPMLVILGVWRHLYRGFPLRYDPMYWGAVFPLGMYTVCTYQVAKVMPAPYLARIPDGFVYIALAAWAATFGGLVRSLVGRAVKTRRA